MNQSYLKTAFAAALAVVCATACTDNNPERNIQAAKDFIQKKDFKSAEIKIKSVQQKNPDLPEGRYLLGTIMLAQQNPVAAEIEFRKARASGYPDNQVIPELARATLLAGQAQKVVDEWSSLHLDAPAADAKLQTTLADAYLVLKKPALAESALAAALTADSNYGPAQVARARIKAISGDFSAALSSWTAPPATMQARQRPGN